MAMTKRERNETMKESDKRPVATHTSREPWSARRSSTSGTDLCAKKSKSTCTCLAACPAAWPPSSVAVAAVVASCLHT